MEHIQSAIRAYFDARQEELIQAVCRLVRIDSTLGPPAPGPPVGPRPPAPRRPYRPAAGLTLLPAAAGFPCQCKKMLDEKHASGCMI